MDEAYWLDRNGPLYLTKDGKFSTDGRRIPLPDGGGKLTYLAYAGTAVFLIATLIYLKRKDWLRFTFCLLSSAGFIYWLTRM